MADINRNSISLPADVTGEIIAKVQEQSAIMRLARQITLPGRGVSIPVITADPTAEWVGETAAKPVSNSGLNTKVLRPYKIAVIETFSKEFTRDAAALYDALIARLPLALAKVFDATVIGAVNKPGSDFDNLAAATAQSIATDAYAGLVAADTDIAAAGGIMNGLALSPQARGILLSAVDSTGRPLFLNSATEGAVDRVLGAPVAMNKALYKAGTSSVPAVVGIAGDWTQAVYGTVNGVEISITDTATLTSGDETISLWQQNMVAVRAEIEVGFRADVTAFNLLTGATAT